jgi:hypothetical protein
MLQTSMAALLPHFPFLSYQHCNYLMGGFWDKESWVVVTGTKSACMGT